MLTTTKRILVPMIISFLFISGLILLTSTLYSIPVYFLWNYVMPVVFHLAPLNYWQAWALTTLCMILFGGMIREVKESSKEESSEK